MFAGLHSDPLRIGKILQGVPLSPADREPVATIRILSALPAGFLWYLFGSSADTSGKIKKIQYFLWEQSGATSIEYALIAGFLSILIIAGVNAIGTTVKGTFNSVANALQ